MHQENQLERSRFLDWMRASGRRVTPERMAVFDEIFRQHRHIDAEELWERLRKLGHQLSRATVYRNLDLLVEAGLVRRYRLGRNHYLFEHVHEGQHHEHLVCVECGRVVEFISPAIAELQAEICRAHGFVPKHHNLQIYGSCENCAEGSKIQSPAGPSI